MRLPWLGSECTAAASSGSAQVWDGPLLATGIATLLALVPQQQGCVLQLPLSSLPARMGRKGGKKVCMSEVSQELEFYLYFLGMLNLLFHPFRQ